MISTAQAGRVAEGAVLRHLSRDEVHGVRAAEMLDSEGKPALRVTITLERDVARRLNGRPVLEAVVEIQDALSLEGEDRFAIVDFEEVDGLEAADDDT